MKINWIETNCDTAVDKVILLVSKWKLQPFKSWVRKGLAFLVFRWYITQKIQELQEIRDISEIVAFFHSI